MSNTSSEKLTTEERIKEAATRVFIRKGYAATKTRDIAEEANINIASLHYYYRSKDKLFQLAVGDAMQQFSNIMDEVFNSEIELHEKIYGFVERYTDFLLSNPFVPIFIINESQVNAERVHQMLDNQDKVELLERQLKDLEARGVIRPTSIADFMMNMVSLTVFPVISKPLIMKKLSVKPEEYEVLLNQRKQLVPEMIINYMYLKKP